MGLELGPRPQPRWRWEMPSTILNASTGNTRTSHMIMRRGLGKTAETAVIVVAVLAIVGGVVLGLSTALSARTTTSPSQSPSASTATGQSTSTSAQGTSCALSNYPDVLNDTLRLTNSTLLELGGSIVGLDLQPHSAFYFGFIPSQNSTVSGEIQTEGTPITVEVLGGSGSAITQTFFNQTGTDVHIEASLPVGNTYRLLLENRQKEGLDLSITQSLQVLYAGC